jgi:hypothetical protein
MRGHANRSGDRVGEGRYNHGRILVRRLKTVPSQRPIDYAHYLPWTRLFRSFRIATDPRKLLLAAVGLTLFWCGDVAISFLPFAPSPQVAPAPPWNRIAPTLLFRRTEIAPADAHGVSNHASSLFGRVIEPVRPLLAMGEMLFGPPTSWSKTAYLWTRLLWALALWSVFGGAIARLAALEIARDERGGLEASVRFAVRRFVSLFSAPLLPVAGILLLLAICTIGGLFGRIAYAGPWIVAVTWGLYLLLAVLILLVAVALAVGWPLMTAAVATENSDAFDGFSRAFSMIYSRPWLALWSGVVAILFGMFLVAVVDTAAVLVESIAARGVATGMSDAGVKDLASHPPGYFSTGPVGPAKSNASAVVTGWLAVLAMIAIGFAVSYFWSAATMIYFILRHADDGTEFDDVWLGEVAEDDLLPLAGIASGDLPVTERSHHPTLTPSLADPAKE